MQATTPPRLTRLSFRRDVRLFFGALAAFYTCLIVLLLVYLRTSVLDLREATLARWRSSATIAVEAINDIAAKDPASVPALLTILQTRYEIAGIMAVTAAGRAESGVSPEQPGVETIEREIHGGRLTLVFDAARLRQSERTFLLTAAISVTATALVAVLLALYLSKITRPIEDMLETAAALEQRPPHDDEQQYLIDTFRRSVVTLQRQEAELRDMHERQKTRADDLERVTAALTRSLTSGFMAIDPSERIVEVNPVGREMLGLSPGVNGSPVADIFGCNDFTDAIGRAVNGRLALSRVEVSCGDRLIGLTTAPLLAGDGAFVGLLALFTDLTPVRSLEARVRALQVLADLGEISAGIAHEFRNSLGTMLGHLQLAMRAELPQQAADQIAKAQREAALLSAAVDGLMAFARPMTLSFEPVRLEEVILPLALELQQSSGVQITTSIEDVTLEGDAALLSRAIENILRNAVESVLQKGSGSVAISVEGAPHPRIIIRDDGVGVDPEKVDRLLLPFQSEKPSGYGMGLPLAKKIVTLHGGTLALSGTPAGGATVTLAFPPH